MKAFITLFLFISCILSLNIHAKKPFFKHPESLRILCENKSLPPTSPNIGFPESYINIDLRANGVNQKFDTLSKKNIESLSICDTPELLQLHAAPLEKLIGQVENLKIFVNIERFGSGPPSLEEFKTIAQLIAAGKNLKTLDLSDSNLFLYGQNNIDKLKILLNAIATLPNLETLDLKGIVLTRHGTHFSKPEEISVLQEMLRKAPRLKLLIISHANVAPQIPTYKPQGSKKSSQILPPLYLAVEEGKDINPSKPFIEIRGMPYSGKLCKQQPNAV